MASRRTNHTGNPGFPTAVFGPSANTIDHTPNACWIAAIASLAILSIPAVCLAQSAAGESAKLLATDGASGARFGSAVAVSGQQALLGAPSDLVNGVRNGSAYVLQLTDGVWKQQAKFAVDDAGADAGFGAAVAMHADLAAVGAPADDRAGQDTGSVFVYREVSGVWTEEAKLSAADPHTNQGFGTHVALDVDTVIVAAPTDAEFGNAAGAVYVFRTDGNVWAQKQKLVGAGVGANSHFGRCLALFDNTLVVGSGVSGGSVHVFEFDGSLWAETDVIPRPGSSTDLFASAVACNGQRIVVGAPQDSSAEFFGGAVYSYSFDGAGWVLDDQLLAFDPGRYDRFGEALALEGNVLVVGTPHDAAGGVNSGSAYVYLHDGVSWVFQSKLEPSDIASTDGFGSGIGVGESLAVLGSPTDDDMGSASGSAYAFYGMRDCDDSGTLDLFEGDDSPDPCGSPGDVDGDGCASISDLLDMLRDLGRRCHRGHRMHSDLDHNGQVNFDDFRRFVREFGHGCNPGHGNGGDHGHDDGHGHGHGHGK